MTTLPISKPIMSNPPRGIEAPAPTAWPVVLAFGFTLICAGLLTSLRLQPHAASLKEFLSLPNWCARGFRWRRILYRPG